MALLIPDIQETAGIVKLATQRLKDAEGKGWVVAVSVCRVLARRQGNCFCFVAGTPILVYRLCCLRKLNTA